MGMIEVEIVEWVKDDYAKSCGICEVQDGTMHDRATVETWFPPHFGCRCRLRHVLTITGDSREVTRQELVAAGIAQANRSHRKAPRVPRRHIRP